MLSDGSLHLQAAVTDRDHQLGPDDAAVTLIEYGDFECPFCARAYPVVKDIRRHFEGRLRFVFRHFPKPEHQHAREAAEAAEAAAAQGEQYFWDMHDLLFQHQGALEHADLVSYAEMCGIDTTRFRADLERHTFRERVHADLVGGARSGVHGTPTFFANGMKYEGADTVDELVEAIEEALTQIRRTTDRAGSPTNAP